MSMPRRPAATAAARQEGAAPPVSIALHKLPPQLRLLVRDMGEAGAYRLVDALGGTPLTVPRALCSPAGQTLAECIGTADAAALIAARPGETMQLPKNDSVLRQLRHQRVLELRTQGMRLAPIALATGYTVRQVINICQRNGVAPGDAGDGPAVPQHDLWPELLGDEPAAHNPG